MKPLRLLPLSDQAILDNVKVASPCHESWDAMSGGDKIRSCDRCQKKVYNLSEMTAAEAVALVRETEGKICVRFHRRADGTMMTADCPVGAGAVRSRRIRQSAAFGGAAAALAGVALFRAEPRAGQTVEATPVVVEVVPVAAEPLAVMGEMPAPPRPGAVMGFAAPEPAVMGEWRSVEPAVQGRMAVQQSAKRFLDTEPTEVRADPFVPLAKDPTVR